MYVHFIGSRCFDKSSVVFICSANFDSELVFYAYVSTKKIVFLFMFYVEVEIRTKLKKTCCCSFNEDITERDEFSCTFE